MNKQIPETKNTYHSQTSEFTNKLALFITKLFESENESCIKIANNLYRAYHSHLLPRLLNPNNIPKLTKGDEDSKAFVRSMVDAKFSGRPRRCAPTYFSAQDFLKVSEYLNIDLLNENFVDQYIAYHKKKDYNHDLLSSMNRNIINFLTCVDSFE